MAPAASAATPDPPPGRAYERVSPADKPSGAMAGLSGELYAMPGRAADEGDRLAYGGLASMGDQNWSGPLNPMMFGERTATGWRSRTVMRSGDYGDTPTEFNLHEARSSWLSRDGGSLVFGTGKPLGWFSSTALPGAYRADGVNAPTWLTEPADEIAPAVGGVATTVTAADDNRVVVFESTARLTADVPAGTRAIYARRGDTLEVVSRLPDGTVAPGGNAYLANGNNGTNAAGPPARQFRNHVAGDGRYVLFVHGGTHQTGRLYVRDLEQGVTRQLAGTGTGIADAANLISSWGISTSPARVDVQTIPNGTVYGARTGPRAFFAPIAPAGSPRVVYEADLQTGTVAQRTAITGPPLALSADGRRMLFLGPPSTPTGSSAPSTGDWTLRYWDADHPTTSEAVGTITHSATTAPYGLIHAYESSADGNTWLFTAIGSLDPDHPNATPTTRQLYRWTVGAGTPTCLTCEPVDGVARTSGVNLSVQDSVSSEGFLTPTTAMSSSTNVMKTNIAQPPHGLSQDGRWLLFDSPDRLVPEDENDVRDVYLWDRDGGSGGQLQLVTSGQGSTPSWALDLSPDGTNAFFTTRDSLVSGDTDGAYDVYTARIGGGFPEEQGPCVEEGCRPRTILDPPAGPVGSDLQTPVTEGPKQQVQQGTPKLRVRATRGSAQRVVVRVDTPKAGRIQVSGANVRTAKRTAKRATTYTVRVSLTSAAKRRVAGGQRVKVNLRVQFTAAGEKKASVVRTSVSVRKGR